MGVHKLINVGIFAIFFYQALRTMVFFRHCATATLRFSRVLWEIIALPVIILGYSMHRHMTCILFYFLWGTKEAILVGPTM